ncbi:MAG TPA: serine protease [Tepidisphaeraceae bacterium]
MLNWMTHFTIGLLVATGSTTAMALTPQLVKDGERATALVKVTDGRRGGGRQIGSAFCVSRAGVFLTTATVADAADNGSLQLVLMVGEAEQRVVDATVIRSDREANIAVLQTEASATLTPLEMETPDQLFATMPVTAFGYPIRGGRIDADNHDLPAASVNAGRITSLQKRDGELERISFDAQLVRGQTGGPVVDDAGHVVGIVDAESNLARSAGGGAIPLGRLHGLNAGPLITMSPQSLPYETRQRMNRLTFNVVPLSKPRGAYEAELSLRSRTGGDPRLMRARMQDGACTFEFVPEISAGSVESIVNARFGEGVISGKVKPVSFKIGSKSVALDHVRRIDRRDSGDYSVALDTGEQLNGSLTGLSDVVIGLGEVTVSLDLTRASRVIVEMAQRPVGALEYSLTVRLGEEVVARESGSIPFSGSPATSGAQTLTEVGQLVDFGKVAALVPSTTPVPTPLAGGNGGMPIQLRGSNLRDVVGFAYEMATWDEKGIIRRLVPFYTRPPASLPASIVMAREGYVVGGILVDSDQYAHAFRVIFMRVDGGRIDTTDNYLSDWIGQPISGLPPKQLAGHGEHVVGVCGRKGLNMDAVGLLVLP